MPEQRANLNGPSRGPHGLHLCRHCKTREWCALRYFAREPLACDATKTAAYRERYQRQRTAR
jgi:hypothetical protein